MRIGKDMRKQESKKYMPNIFSARFVLGLLITLLFFLCISLTVEFSFLDDMIFTRVAYKSD
jgi:hypothetical protein